jgi:transcription initiation factor TFIIIB Brf1 subunit/transcription initiation factor TFIIB
MGAALMETCQDCSRALLDLEDELVCPGCGVVKEKAVVEDGRGGGKLPLFGRHPLGSFMGTKGVTPEERRSNVSGGRTSYMRMKTLSDFAAREGTYAECGRLIERVGEKLSLPRVAVLQAASISKKVLEGPRSRRLTVAQVSAYSLVAACKIEGVTAVSIREVLAAFGDLGRGVTSSSIFHIALDSPLRTYARRAEDYLPMVIARLSMNARLSARLRRERAQAQGYLESLRRLAGEILAECDRTSIAGKRPCALAASAVYSAEATLAAREGRPPRVTQRECAKCGDTAEYTVRDHCATTLRAAAAKVAARNGQTPPVRSGR